MKEDLDKYSDYDVLCLMDYAFSQLRVNDVLICADRLMKHGEYMFEAAFKSAVAEYYLGNFETAKFLFEKAFEFQNHASCEKHIFRAASVKNIKKSRIRNEELFSLAKKFFNENRYEEAFELTKLLLKHDKNNAAYNRLAGSLCIKLNDFRTANIYFSVIRDRFSVQAE